jgi:hypothetical protein
MALTLQPPPQRSDLRPDECNVVIDNLEADYEPTISEPSILDRRIRADLV